ncbi:HAD-IA family hydrolase [Aliarcobacter butzleri]|uniref:HAD-IA family hydrolase n=1 Tax=Aliarcobacter butzleri TaxID=28197 RepID=UPI003AF87187
MNHIFEKSAVEQEYIKLLQQEEIRIVSFDIFDTLVFRKVAQPQEIFKKIGKHKFVKQFFNTAKNFQHYRIQAEQNARKSIINNEDVTIVDIYEKLPLSPAQRKKIIEIEINIENDNLFINQQLDKWILLAHKYKKEVILISDIYFSSQQIQKLVLNKLTYKKLIKKVFISNECQVAKYTGNLYYHVQKECGVNFKEILHVGDNRNSDINIAQNIGLNTLYYGASTFSKKSQKLEFLYLNNSLPKYNTLRLLTETLTPYSDKNSQEHFFYYLGCMIYGPLLYKFTYWILQIYKNKSLNQINLLMREGRLFKKCLHKLDNTLEVNLVYASRHSTYLATLDINDFFISLQKEKIDNSFFKTLSLVDLLTLLKVKLKKVEAISHNNKSLVDISLEEPKLFQTILNELISQKSNIIKNQKKEQQSIRTYFQQLSIKKNSMIIDFGPNGTIIERLKEICGDMFPYYSGLFYKNSELKKQDINILMKSFLFDNKNNLDFITALKRSPACTETLFNGSEETTVGYNHINKKILPQRKKTIDINESIINSFDQGILTFFEIAEIYNLSSKSIKKNEAFGLLGRLIESPTYDEAKQIGMLPFDMGAGRNHDKKHIINSNSLDTTKYKEIYLKHLNNKNYKKYELEWIEGYIVMHNPLFILYHKGFLQKIGIDESVNFLVSELQINSIQNIIIYGTGEFYKVLFNSLKHTSVKIDYLIDSQAQSLDSIDGFKIRNLDSINTHGLTLVIASASFVDEIKDKVINYCYSKNLHLTIIDCIEGTQSIQSHLKN